MNMGYSFRSISLRHFIISSMLPILALFCALSFYYNWKALEFNKDVYAGALDAGSSALNMSFAELEQISFTPYLYNDISRMMTYMKNGYLEEKGEVPDYLNLAQLETNYTLIFTKLLHASSQDVRAIRFYPFGEAYGACYSINRDTAGLSRTEASEESIETLYSYTAPYGSKAVFLSLEDIRETSADAFVLLRTIKDYDSGKDLGILEIEVGTSQVCDSLDRINITANSGLLLTDQTGSVIYSAGTATPELLAEASENSAYIVQDCALERADWKLSLIISVNDFRVSTAESVGIIFVVALLAFVAGFVIYRLQSAGAVVSIDSILYAIRQLQDGNLNYTCKVAAGNEDFQAIADALNQTGQKLDELIHTEAEARASQSKAEYLALQSQINPHFLYNVLNGFIALNRMGERQLLEDSILHLTKLFRYICNNDDTATVAREYDFAVQYLELQKLRFGDQITYTVMVDPAVADIQIPKLVVQPFVENCVVHGMESDGTPIEIILHSMLRREEDGGKTLILEIVDTGVGYDTASTPPGVGLTNVMQRLKIFHERSHYEIRSTPGKGTTVRILLEMNHENT